MIDPHEASQRIASLSPDGRWVAYDEDSPQSGSEVFVHALNGSAGRRQVSAGGGSQPRFTRGGREVVFRRGAAVLSTSFNPARSTGGTSTCSVPTA